MSLICSGQLYCLQARPIVTLPCSSFFRPDARGSRAILWDNSNIVESYSGVTAPLTFSFASGAYKQVPNCVCICTYTAVSVARDTHVCLVLAVRHHCNLPCYRNILFFPFCVQCATCLRSEGRIHSLYQQWLCSTVPMSILLNIVLLLVICRCIHWP